MAQPRVFVSSTYFDLRQVRSDLESFIRELGYDAVLNETGKIPYSKDVPLEECCYREIPRTHILVAIIGGRYGSSSARAPHSITQMEIKTALELSKQVYIFIDRNVYAEYRTYEKNKANESVIYGHAERPVYEFVEYLYGLQRNNAIFPFESAQDIVGILRDQWAGLFQTFLEAPARQHERREIEDLQATARSMKDIASLLTSQVQALSDERRGHDEVLRGHAERLRDVLLSSHPAMAQIRKLLGVSYRVYFTTRNELSDWLKARMFKPLDGFSPGMECWKIVRDGSDVPQSVLMIDSDIFDKEGRLRVFGESEWDPKFIQYLPSPAGEPVQAAQAPGYAAYAPPQAPRGSGYARGGPPRGNPASPPPDPAPAVDDYAGDYGGGTAGGGQGTDDDIPF